MGNAPLIYIYYGFYIDDIIYPDYCIVQTASYGACFVLRGYIRGGVESTWTRHRLFPSPGRSDRARIPRLLQPFPVRPGLLCTRIVPRESPHHVEADTENGPAPGFPSTAPGRPVPHKLFVPSGLTNHHWSELLGEHLRQPDRDRIPYITLKQLISEIFSKFASNLFKTVQTRILFPSSAPNPPDRRKSYPRFFSLDRHQESFIVREALSFVRM